MSDDAPQAPPLTLTAPQNDALEVTGVTIEPSAPASGKRPSFRDIRRQLTEDELKQTGVQKLLIEDFERAENECESLRKYVDKFHDADKEVARFEEKLRVNVALEVLTGAGLAGGGAIISLAPSIWNPKDTMTGIAAIGVGFVFVIASIIAKVVQAKR